MHETATPLAPTTGRSPRRARPHAPRVGRPHADAARGRAVLEGVHQPDRARQDAADRVDDRLARRTARRRSGAARPPGSRRRSARRSRRLSLAPRRSPPRTSYDDAVEAYREVRPSVEGTGARSLELRVLTGEAWALQEVGQVQGGDRAPAAARASSSSEAASRTSISPTSSTALARLPLQAFERLDRDRALRRGARRWRSGPASRATSCARTSCSAGRAAIAGCATTSPRTTTSSGRSSSRRISAIARRSRTPTSRRRSSRSGRATTCSRAATRSARRSSTSS